MNSIFAGVTIIVLSVFMVGGGRQWFDKGAMLMRPDHAALIDRVVDRMAIAVGNYVAGALAQATIAGITTFIVLSILSVPFAAPLSVVVFFFDLIPLVGATIAAIVVGLVTVFANFPTATIVWAIWAIVYQQIENNVIQPQIQKRAVDIHPFVVLVSVLFGSALFGIAGALLGDPGRRLGADRGARVLALHAPRVAGRPGADAARGAAAAPVPAGARGGVTGGSGPGLGPAAQAVEHPVEDPVAEAVADRPAEEQAEPAAGLDLEAERRAGSAAARVGDVEGAVERLEVAALGPPGHAARFVAGGAQDDLERGDLRVGLGLDDGRAPVRVALADADALEEVLPLGVALEVRGDGEDGLGRRADVDGLVAADHVARRVVAAPQLPSAVVHCYVVKPNRAHFRGRPGGGPGAAAWPQGRIAACAA